MDLPEEHIESFCKKYRLSPRESQIVRLILEGVDSNKEIAERLNITTGTAKIYIHNLNSKLNTNSRLSIALKVLREF